MARGRKGMAGWVAGRVGLAEAEPYLRAARALARDAEVTFPRELRPLLAENLGRGLLAALIFQQQPEWVWPYWVVRQLDPRDEAYLPRGLSPIWLNLTHRNWVAVGTPDGRMEAIVDPRGLVTPRPGGWSVDCAVHTGGQLHAPSRLRTGYRQRVDTKLPRVAGRWKADGVTVRTEVWPEQAAGAHLILGCVTVAAGNRAAAGEVAISLRPYNPEGPALVQALSWEAPWLTATGRPALRLSSAPARVALSTWDEGDALVHDCEPGDRVDCPVGLATAAAFFPFELSSGDSFSVGWGAVIEPEVLDAGRAAHLAAALDAAHGVGGAAVSGGSARVATPGRHAGRPGPSDAARRAWRRRVDDGARFVVPEARVQAAFDRAHLTLLVLDDNDAILPGPATYHRPWVRDSAYLVTALGRLGHRERARQKLGRYASQQDRSGQLSSQEGEWDATGQALWTVFEHHRLFGDDGILRENLHAMARGALWIAEKRQGARPPGCKGLLPPGISAEHLGTHDHYFWDDLWGVAGLRAAAAAEARVGRSEAARRFTREADAFTADLVAAFAHAERRLGRKAIPAAPNRRYDAGMIGALAAVHPLDLLDADDPRIVDTLAVLEERFFLDGAFFQTMVHSGQSPYLTLQCAQAHLRAGRIPEAWRLARRILELGSPPGIWPEAVHPRTGGGSMGDGCHGWASAEWALFVRGALVMEQGDVLVLTPGMPDGALVGCGVASAPTWFGEVSFTVEGPAQRPVLDWRPRLRSKPRRVLWRVPGEGGSSRTVEVPLEAARIGSR